ncbi:MAG: putative addiction module antidote protein [Burkholderiales bacterium]|nr:putative addiction module antidote protein [Burkholderiales bacterium]
MKATASHDDFMRERLADVRFAADYLQAALDDGDRAELLLALRRIAEARGGMGKLARATGLTREALYRTLSASGNPRLTSLSAILGAAGLRLAIVPARGGVRRGKRRAGAAAPA